MRCEWRTVAKGFFALASILGFIGIVNPPVQAQTFSVIHSFSGGTDGANPEAGLVMDASGDLYGTTTSGGEYGVGTIIEYSSGGVESTIYSFKGGTDGEDPQGALMLVGGSLYGTTLAGGAYGEGTVFSVTLAGKETILYSFNGKADGANPEAMLTRDSSGNFYSTTFAGGTYGGGTVFKLARPTARGGSWTEQVLYSFGATDDGINPVAGVTFDSAGNLYGTASAGGQYGNGTVFQLVPSGSAWTENILHQFAMTEDGGIPYAGIVLDHAGNLYGAATDGGAGGSNGGGTIFKLSPSSGTWTFAVIYTLPGWGISGSFRNLYLASPNKIYATTHCDGNSNAGTVFELTYNGKVWSYTSLYVFNGGTDGLYSFSSPVLDKSGDLYGTTQLGGAYGNGVIFKVHLP